MNKIGLNGEDSDTYSTAAMSSWSSQSTLHRASHSPHRPLRCVDVGILLLRHLESHSNRQ